MAEAESSVMLPGDKLPSSALTGGSIKLGPGLQQSQYGISKDAVTVASVSPGTLQHTKKGNKWWIDRRASRYSPAAQESVIGFITHRTQDMYRVDIGSAHSATLDALAFEGATKRNKPNLKVGTVVYARVSLAHRDMEPELECFDASTRKADGFGELKGGFVVTCNLSTCRALLDRNHYLLPLIGARVPLEIAIGINGRVWISSDTIHNTVLISRCIQSLDERDPGEAVMRSFINDILSSR
ncbi:exosome complex component RRP40 [Ceratobasidium sp. AG-Ba]|nr:exosome complex component RRP40 [Ceratobasidium sp. AG-Ba]QRW06503.1 exosome complex component RRP40 [Ceratobasidium sp. AG-Ba]